MSKKVLMISSLYPLKGLPDNDIVLRNMEALKDNYDIEFIVIRPIVYSNCVLARIKNKWKQYYKYNKLRKISSKGFITIFFPMFIFNSKLSYHKYLIPISYFVFKRKVKNYISSEHFDLIHAQNNTIDGYLAYKISKEFKIPYIVTVRGAKEKDFFQHRIFNNILTNATSINTPSPYAFKRLTDKGIDIKFIPHGVDNRFYHSIKNDFDTLRLLTVAKLIPLKNIEIVIEVVSILIKEYPEIKINYKIVGEGSERVKLEKLIENLDLNDIVSLEGYVSYDEVYPYFYWSNIFIMPSFPETLGRVYLEAAAAMNVVIGTKNTGAYGLFKHKESALFVRQDNIKNDLLNCFHFIVDKKINVNKLMNNAKLIIENHRETKIISKLNKEYQKI